MPLYSHPGVYVEETFITTPPIQAVGMSRAVFLGRATNLDARVAEPVDVRSLAEYTDIFGPDSPEHSYLAGAVAGFFANGGRDLFVINLGAGSTSLVSGDLDALNELDEFVLLAAPGFTDRESHDVLLNHAEKRRDRFAVLDLADTKTTAEQIVAPTGIRPRASIPGLGAVYAPWLSVLDAFSGACRPQPPSGHICGLIAQNDLMRGVWNSPANLALNGVSGLTRNFSAAEQDVLNPASVNCVRRFTTGLRLWGARTLAQPGSEYRYVSVRRLALLIEKSVQDGTKWAVLEPNAALLWTRVRRAVEDFLIALWRGGALIGIKPDHAYFVRCGLGQTMTDADIQNGLMHLEIGFAPLKPAEFVILRLSFKMV